MSNKLSFQITGVSPLIMHNGKLADPLDKMTRAVKEVSGKRNKTESDYEELARLEWLGSLYVKDGKIVVPAMNIEATFLESARKRRMGKQAQAGVYCDGEAPLVYDGPVDIDELWRDDRFRLTVGVRVKGARIMRTRPIFERWSIGVTLRYDESLLNRDVVVSILNDAGDKVGLCDWRPRFGRFTVEVVE